MEENRQCKLIQSATPTTCIPEAIGLHGRRTGDLVTKWRWSSPAWGREAMAPPPPRPVSSPARGDPFTQPKGHYQEKEHGRKK